MLRKIIAICFCMLLIGTVLPVSGNIIVDNKNENTLFDSDVESGKFKWGFIIGPVESIKWEGDLLVIKADHPPGGDMSRTLRFFIPFSIGLVLYTQQIKIQFKYGILRNDFVIGFCRIFIPESEISMHMVSHDDSKNKVTWEIDEINGDPIWKYNMKICLYPENYSSLTCGPFGMEYLSVGDQIYVYTDRDGYYRLEITDYIFGDVLFESDYVKF